MANICDKCSHKIVCKYKGTCDECNQFAEDINVPSKWISVEDRLPKNKGDYLVIKASGTYRWCEVLSFAKDGRKVDKYDFEREWENVWYRYDSEWGYVTTDSVTHWMPLPEPPKGE